MTVDNLDYDTKFVFVATNLSKRFYFNSRWLN